MILVIDNYDSFTFNLVHYLMELGAEVRVERNDALTATEALATGADAFLISPGPCTPNEAGKHGTASRGEGEMTQERAVSC